MSGRCRHEYDRSSVPLLRLGRRVSGDDSPAGRQVRLPSAATRESRMTAKPSKHALRVDFPTRNSTHSTRALVIPYSDLAAPAKNVSR
jgi:hypothetical protein